MISKADPLADLGQSLNISWTRISVNNFDFPQKHRISEETSQELRMLSSVIINCQVTKIVINPGSQLSVLSVSQMSQIPMIGPLGCSVMEVRR